MEAKEISEMLVSNATLTWLIARENFSERNMVPPYRWQVKLLKILYSGKISVCIRMAGARKWLRETVFYCIRSGSTCRSQYIPSNKKIAGFQVLAVVYCIWRLISSWMWRRVLWQIANVSEEPAIFIMRIYKHVLDMQLLYGPILLILFSLLPLARLQPQSGPSLSVSVILLPWRWRQQALLICWETIY
jgi:hypothetical protein